MNRLTTIEHIRFIGDNFNKLTQSMDTLLWGIHKDLAYLIYNDQEEQYKQQQIKENNRQTDFDRIKQGNWWCVVDYGDDCIKLRVGSKGSVIGTDYFHSINPIDTPTIKNVDDVPRDIWMLYNSIQLTSVPTLRELIISVRGC